MKAVGPGFGERVYDVVARVPAGSITTYGDVAEALGSRRVARHVGHALAALPEDRGDVPWHRVVNARGFLSPRSDGRLPGEQRARLEGEGVRVDDAGRVLEFARRRRSIPGATVRR